MLHNTISISGYMRSISSSALLRLIDRNKRTTNFRPVNDSRLDDEDQCEVFPETEAILCRVL